MNSIAAWNRVLHYEQVGLLKFHTNKHRLYLEVYLKKMTGMALDIAINSLDGCLSSDYGFVSKVIKANNPGIHFSLSYSNWQVAGWLHLKKHDIDVRIKDGVKLKDMNLKHRKISRRSSPHNLIVTIDNQNQISLVPDLIIMSAEI